MAPLVLDGVTLGERHRHYNKELKKALADRTSKLDPINYEDNDIDNLLKIDVACKTKNVDYILEVLKSEDQLYVSRALKRSAWLVAEPAYAHVVNPQYLHQHVFPYMTTKAINKLMLHIRKHLADEKRVEEFYSYVAETSLKAATKWLPNCSLNFKLDVEHDIPVYIFKRMHKKDPEIFSEYIKMALNKGHYPTHAARLLAKSHPGDYLNLVASQSYSYDLTFMIKTFYCGSSTTQVMLKKCPKILIDNFHHYVNIIHIPSFVKHLNKVNGIKKFLWRHSHLYHNRLTFDNLKYFLDEIPQEDTAIILKRIFKLGYVSDGSDENNSSDDDESDSNESGDNDGGSNKTDEEDSSDVDEDSSNDNDSSSSNENDNNNSDIESDESETIVEEAFSLSELYHKIAEKEKSHPYFVWYEFAPFEDAKIDLQKLIYAESTPKSRHSILMVLLACARRVPERLQAVLQYYHDRHINEGLSYKAKFLHNLVSKIGVHNLNEETWNLLDDIYRSMELYIESNNKNQACIKTIILYKVLHDEHVPEIIEQKFEFDSLKMYKNELSLADGNKIFEYLLNVITQRIAKLNIRYESDFQEIVTSLINMWNLLKDWEKEPQYFTLVMGKINELLTVKKEISRNVNLSSLYKMLGRWRRQLFSESLVLCASEETCLNALKHEPQLLERYNTELHALRAADTVAPRRLLAKLRIYWSHTLGKQWTEEYFSHINDATGHKALIKGLYLLQPSHKLISFIKQHAPEDNKIEWTEDNELQTNIRRHIAKNMHLARPPLSTEAVLWYAKGDYLQYAQLSLNSIYYNLKTVQVNEHILKLVTGPVSVQKHGIRQAYDKLKPEELKTLYLRLWKNTKNRTIRTVIFTCTFKLFCKEIDESLIKDFWTLLDTYIDDLNEDDNKIIFKTLGNVKLVPFSVRAEFLMKSYVFLKSLPDKADCEAPMSKLMKHAPELMEYLDSEFVCNILLEAADIHILNGKEIVICILSAYLLCTKDENVQNQRFQKKFAPILEQYIARWVKERNKNVRSCIENMIGQLCGDISNYVFQKQMVLPTEIIKKMYTMIEKVLSPQNDYVLLTSGKLTVDYIILLKYLTETCEDNYTWIQIQRAAITPFGKICLKYLKEDIARYFPTIYALYANACQRMFNNYQLDEIVEMDMVESFLDPDVIESYLLSRALLPGSYSWHSDENDEKEHRIKAVSEIISKHPSEVVKLLHYRHFQSD